MCSCHQQSWRRLLQCWANCQRLRNIRNMLGKLNTMGAEIYRYLNFNEIESFPKCGG
jgi:hypothetical protein